MHYPPMPRTFPPEFAAPHCPLFPNVLPPPPPHTPQVPLSPFPPARPGAATRSRSPGRPKRSAQEAPTPGAPQEPSVGIPPPTAGRGASGQGGLRCSSVSFGTTTGYPQNGGGGRRRAEGAGGAAGGTHPFQHLDEAQRLLEAAPAHPGQDPVLRNGESGVNGGQRGGTGLRRKGAPGSSAGHGGQRGPTWSRGALSPPEGAPDSAMAAAVGAVGGCRRLLRPPPPLRSQSRPRAATRSLSAPGRAQPPRPGHNPDRPRPPATTVHGAAPDRPRRTPRCSSGVNPAPAPTGTSVRPSIHPRPANRDPRSSTDAARGRSRAAHPGIAVHPAPPRPAQYGGTPRPRAAAYRGGSAARGGSGRMEEGRPPHTGGPTATRGSPGSERSGAHRAPAPTGGPHPPPTPRRCPLPRARHRTATPTQSLTTPTFGLTTPPSIWTRPLRLRCRSALAPPLCFDSSHSLPSEPALLASPLAAFLPPPANGLAARGEVTQGGGAARARCGPLAGSGCEPGEGRAAPVPLPPPRLPRTDPAPPAAATTITITMFLTRSEYDR